jgi:hypothetical protein
MSGFSMRKGFFRWLAEEKARLIAQGRLPPDTAPKDEG